MTIILVMHSHKAGGVERHVVALGESLVERGHQVYLACPNRGWMWDAVRDGGVRPYHVAMDGLFDLTSVGRLSRLVRSTRADIIHSHMTRGSFYATKVGRRLGVPVIATSHTATTYKHYAGADRVLCVSEAARQNLLRHAVRPEILRVEYNGIALPARVPSEERVAEIRASWGIPHGGKAVGTLVRVTPDKDLNIILQVASRWKTERPEVRFVLSGISDEKTELGLRSQVEQRGLDDNVVFTGLVNNPFEVLASYDVLAAPTRSESFSLALLESMAVRTPVVASRAGGTPEIITHELTGFLVEPGDPDSLAAGLAKALDNPGVPALVDRAEAMVHHRFTLNRMVDDIEEQYRDLLKVAGAGVAG